MKTDDIAAYDWLIKQPGINLTVRDGGKINLRYGYVFNVTGNDIADAVSQIQQRQRANDNAKR